MRLEPVQRRPAASRCSLAQSKASGSGISLGALPVTAAQTRPSTVPIRTETGRGLTGFSTKFSQS